MMNDEQAREMLKEHGLRSTLPRLVVLRALAESEAPVSWAELTERLGEEAKIDPATIFRNLQTLTKAGVAELVGHFDGRGRYALPAPKSDGGHTHPHFVCEDCGEVACLPDDVIQAPRGRGRWAASVRGAKLQLRGECPDCRQSRRAP